MFCLQTLPTAAASSSLMPSSVRRVDHHVDALQICQFAQLQGGERGLQWATATDDHHFLHAAGAQRLQRVVGDVGAGEYLGIGHQNARDVECDVAVAYNNSPGAGQIGRYLLKVRMSVVPAHEIDRSDAARQLFAGDVQRSVRLRADRVDHRVVVLGQFGRADVLAHHDVAEKPEPRVVGGLLELLADRLDLGVVGRDPGAHQSPRRRQHLQHVNGDFDLVVRVGGFEQRRRGEESRGARADDCDVVRTHNLRC